MINKIISITIVKNECDIIEEFVRYNLQFVDEMYIIEHMSTDSTFETLLKLKKEGLPIQLYRYDSYRYDQGQSLTKLYNIAIEENQPDFVVFIDADEFISAKSKEEFLEILLEFDAPCYSLDMIQYVYKTDDENKNLPIHQKFIYKSKQVWNYKSIINVKYCKNRKITVADGAHWVSDENGIINSQHIDLFHLAHFAFRSKEQILSKILIGSFAFMVRIPKFKDGNLGGHWANEYKRLIDNNQIKSISVPSASTTDLINNMYSLNPLPLKCQIKYIDKINVDALENSIYFLEDYINYNGDKIKRHDIIEFLNNINKEDRINAIYQVAKTAETYIMENNWEELRYGNLYKLNL